MERPPRHRDEKLLSLDFILHCYFVQGSILAFTCYATYYYMGWVLGAWRPGVSLSSMPASPGGLRFNEASWPYLQTLTAYFFPTITTQIANVMCKRSSTSSLFSREFLNPRFRRESLEAIARWHPPRYTARVKIDLHVTGATEPAAARAFFALSASLLALPFKFLWLALLHAAVKLEDRVIVPFTAWLSRFLQRHYVLYNFISNPLIDLGILFELVLCYVFFYSPLAKVYYFAPVPWHVYLFAFHGMFLLLAFEEVRKYYRRKSLVPGMLGSGASNVT